MSVFIITVIACIAVSIQMLFLDEENIIEMDDYQGPPKRYTQEEMFEDMLLEEI